jgi:hypothetical protein
MSITQEKSTDLGRKQKITKLSQSAHTKIDNNSARFSQLEYIRFWKLFYYVLFYAWVLAAKVSSVFLSDPLRMYRLF